MIIDTKDINEARRIAQKSSEKPIIVRGQDDGFNRKMLDWGKFDILLSVEESGRGRDKAKQLDSGLNHVLAEIAAKKGVSFGVDLEEIRALGTEEKARRMAKIRQNLKICRKAKARIVCLNYKDKRNAADFLVSLGASTEQASGAFLLLNFCEFN